MRFELEPPAGNPGSVTGDILQEKALQFLELKGSLLVTKNFGK